MSEIAGRPTGPDTGPLFAAATDGFGDAARRLGEHVERLRIADLEIQVRVAGDGLARSLLPALARCRADPGEPVHPEPITFRAWDSVGSGVAAPRPPWSMDDFLPRDGIRGSGQGGIEVAYALASRILWMWRRSVRSGVLWTRDAGGLPSWEPTAPLRYLLRWALGDAGLVVAHAAAVGTARGGVLLVGPGGSGKSTTSLVCVEAGWQYVSDDYCALSTTGGATAHALYGIGKVSPDLLAGMPGLASAASRQRDDGKVVLDLARALPGQMAPSLPLRAIVIPTVAAATGRLRPLSASAGARALAPSSLFQQPGGRPGSLGAIAAAMEGLSVFGLEVGPDLAQIPPALLPALEASG